MYTLKPRLAALGFALTLLTTPSLGQQAIPSAIGQNYGPPHNVIYWLAGSTDAAGNNIQSSLTSPCDPNNGPTGGGSATSPSGCYTDVIIFSLYPDPTCTFLVDGTNGQIFNNGGVAGAAGIVQALHQAGKTVLLSFGGPVGPLSSNAPLTTANYNMCYYNNMSGLIQMILNYVLANNFDGVDIDFEDSSSFGTGPGSTDTQIYDGVGFLEQLTNGLGQQLPFPHNIITHAPQTAYWTSTYTPNNGFSGYPYPPYVNVYNNTNGYISWFNHQFYDDGSLSVSDKESEYDSIVNSVVGTGGPGVLPPIMLVLGLPLSQGGCNCGELNPSDTNQIITDLQRKYPGQFGGVMGWVAESDNGTWNSLVWNALKANQAKWAAASPVSGCLDNPGSGTLVQLDQCVLQPTAYWQFSANYIINAVTGNCLDIHNGVHVEACAASGNEAIFQTWKFYGNMNGGVSIVWANSLNFTPQQPASACLDASQSNLFVPCTGGPSQNWAGGLQLQ
jgi:chitinase